MAIIERCHPTLIIFTLAAVTFTIGCTHGYYRRPSPILLPTAAKWIRRVDSALGDDTVMNRINSCAANPASPCIGRNITLLLETMPGDNAKKTLESVEVHWGKHWPGPWRTHVSNHWEIQHFNRCSHASSNSVRAKSRAKRGVIFTLVNVPSVGYDAWRATAIARFKNWSTQLLAVMRAPLVIFAQTDVPLQFQSDVRQIFAATGGVVFKPARLTPDRLRDVRPTPKHPNKYTEMCLYLAFDAYQDPVFDDVEFFLRLDSDATFEQPVSYDMFEEIGSGGFMTAYSMLGMPEIWPEDRLPAMSDLLLRPVLANLLRRGILPPPDFSATGNHGLADTLWSGPLQLSAVALYRSDAFFRFMEAIDIWNLTAMRVREQATNTLWLKMAVPRARALWLCDLDMVHKIRFPPRCERIHCNAA